MGDFAPQIAALLVGGLSGSLGLTWAVRRPAPRRVLARLRGVYFAPALLSVSGLAAWGAFLLVRGLFTEGTPSAEQIAPGRLLVFGLLVGVPLSLPGLLFAWSEARSEARRRHARRDFVPTKDDRRQYAEDLARQIEEVSPTKRAVRASIGGDGGRVLVLQGDIEAAEGERLTSALRGDLSELGFKRVEGGAGSGAWWSRV